jgi:hypothetical protein
MGIDAIDWDGSDYQVKVMTDSPRPNYVYDEAAKGSFYIRNSDNVENLSCTSLHEARLLQLSVSHEDGGRKHQAAPIRRKFLPDPEQIQCTGLLSGSERPHRPPGRIWRIKIKEGDK